MAFFPIPWYLIIALIFIVILSTSLGAMTGFSGSVFIVPAFSLILLNYNVPFITIVGSSASGCFFNGLIATLLIIRKKEIDWLLALVFEIPTMLGVFLGAYSTTKLDNRIISTIFVTFVIILAIIMFIQNRRKNILESINGEISKEEEMNDQKDVAEEKMEIKKRTFLRRISEFGPQRVVHREEYSYTISIPILLGSAFLIGLLAGMVGCGGGWIKSPVLISGFGVPSLIAISTAMFMTTITLFISGVTHIILGHFVFWLWLIIFIGSVSGSFIGTALKKRFTSRVLRYIMTFTLIVIAGILLIQTWIVF